MSHNPPAQLVRSLLFAPANRPELLEKFPRYQADVYAIDLEDGTPAADKASARGDLSRVVPLLRERGLPGQLFVRINEWGSPHAVPDLEAALATPVDGIMVPKLARPSDLARILDAIGRAESPAGRSFRLIGMIETAAGVVNVEALAAGGDPHLVALAFGAEDFMTELGGRRTPEGVEVLYARSRIVLAARAFGLDALDLVFVSIRDDEAFRRDAELGRQLGYSGKMCVVPRQAVIANEVFSPSAEEIARSQRLIDAAEAAGAAGYGAIDFEGGMVDEPLLRRARAIVQMAGAAKGSGGLGGSG